ncbi:hypothetical protein Tco_0594701 [Tanacetum coccineum]
MLVQPTEDEGAPSERPSEAQSTPSPPHSSEEPVEPQTGPSPRPSPSTNISDSIPESSGGNLGGHSSSDKSLSGNKGDMTLQSIKKLKKQAKPVITHHKAWMKSVSLQQRLAGKRSLKETEDAQDVGRTRDVVDKEKENAEDLLSTEDVLSTAQQKVSTDKEKVSTDRPIVSTDKEKVSTDKEKDSTDELNESTDDQIEGTNEQNKGIDDHTEGGSATQTTQTPTSTIFGDDETIAQVLLNMSQAKAVSREKEKEEDESESESNGIPEAEKKFKQLASDEEMARKVQEEWEGEEERKRLAEEEATNDALIKNYDDIKARIEADRLLAEKLQEEKREQFTIEEIAKFLHDTIDAQRKFLAQQRSEYQKQTTYKESIEKSNDDLLEAYEDFISIGSAEDERLIKKINEKEIDSSKNETVKEEDKEEEDGDYLVIYRANGNFRAFNYLIEVLHIFDRQDLFHLYDLIREQYSEVTLDGFVLILWGDLKIMMESSTKGNVQSDFWSGQQDWKIITWRLYESCGVCILEFKDGIVIHMLVERRYPLSKDLLQRMLDLGLEVERESFVALDLIRFIKHKNWLVHKQTAYGKDFSNPFMVDNLPKIVGFSTHLASLVKSWLVQDQIVLGKDYSNLLITDSLLKTIWFINAPCYGNEVLTSPKANELAIPEQTTTSKGISNPLMAGSLPKTTKPT